MFRKALKMRRYNVSGPCVGVRKVEFMYEDVDVVAHKSKRPALRHSATEFSRALSEALHLSSFWPLHRAPVEGDGHAVFVMPGFLGSDASTVVLRQYLRRHGFDARPWLQGRNTGRARVQTGLVREFLRLSDRHKAPVSLVGHSLGGVYARELARQHPDRVRGVVSLGSPFASATGGSVARLVREAFEQISKRSVTEFRATISASDPRLPPGVPSTSIYSRTDGVVHWHSCLEQNDALTENIEVYGSHCGMVVNVSVLQAVADRLAQPHQNWQKFAPREGVSFRYPRHQGAQ